MEKQVIKQVVIDLLRRGHIVKIKASGVSMVPMLWPKMVLYAQPCSTEDLKIGDIALFDNDSDHLIAHRVIATRSDAVLFQGDSCLTPDGWIERPKIMGKIVKAKAMGIKVDLTWTVAHLYGKIQTYKWPHKLNHITALAINKILRLKGRIFSK